MNVQISERAEKDFKNFVVTKYGQLKGTPSLEVEKALMHNIASEPGAQQGARGQNDR